MEVLVGIFISAIVAWIAYRRNSLTMTGLMSATLVGGLLYWWGGLITWVALISFFVTSSILTKVKHSAKKSVDAIIVRGGRRDHVQVMANGLVPLVFSFLYYFYGQGNPHHLFLIAAITAIAASNSDTWASELGVLSKGKTIHILSWKVIDKGLSGGISLFGTAVAALGAFFIGLIFVLMDFILHESDLPSLLFILIVITSGGFLGSLVDSFLGASVQAKYKGLITGKITEKAKDIEQTILTQGIRWITNDIVNLSSALSASLFVFLFRLS